MDSTNSLFIKKRRRAAYYRYSDGFTYSILLSTTSQRLAVPVTADWGNDKGLSLLAVGPSNKEIFDFHKKDNRGCFKAWQCGHHFMITSTELWAMKRILSLHSRTGNVSQSFLSFNFWLFAFYRKIFRILPFNLLPSTYFFRPDSKQSLRPLPFLFRKEIC